MLKFLRFKMKTIYKPITQLLLALLLHGFGYNGQKVKRNNLPTTGIEEGLKLQKIKEFVLEHNGFKIGSIEPPMLVYAKDDNVNFILYDRVLAQLLVTDTSGTILQTIGKIGDGPDGLRHILSFGVDADTLVVYDGVHEMIKKFNLEGELTKSYEGFSKDGVWGRSKRLFSYNDNLIFGVQEQNKSYARNHWESKTIAIYDREGNLERLMGEYDPDLVNSYEFYNYSNDIVAHNGFVYTTHRTSPTIQKFDLDTGKKVSRFGVLSKNFKVSNERPNATDSRDVKNKIITKFSIVGNSYVTDDYFAFYFFRFTEKYFELRDPNDQEHYLNLYNNKEEFVGEISLPFQLIAMDNNNRLYLLEDDNPDNVVIGVYEIEYK